MEESALKQPESVSEELLIIRMANNGVLNPKDVVMYARNPETLLHRKFEWDDAKAAYEHRLWQAREIIRSEVAYMVVGEKEVEIREFVSLYEDRTENGGYRLLQDVLSDENRRERLLTQAKIEMLNFKKKYQMLKELADVTAAIDKTLDELK